MADLTDHEMLEEERSFLLRSLDDLDAEFGDGNIDDETYVRLRADYTARTARVLQRLDGDRGPAGAPAAAPDSGRPPTSAARRVLVGLGVVVFATVVAITLAYGLGARLPGETITGSQGGSAAVADAAARQAAQLRAAIRLKPEDSNLRLSLARILMGQAKYRSALMQFQNAARIDPTNPEPFAYSGWLIRLQGFPDQGLTLLDKALQVRPDYLDARFFKGLILLRDRHQPDAAIAEFRQYLGSSPDSPLANQVRNLLAEAVGAQRTSNPSTTPSSSP